MRHPFAVDTSGHLWGAQLWNMCRWNSLPPVRCPPLLSLYVTFPSSRCGYETKMTKFSFSEEKVCYPNFHRQILSGTTRQVDTLKLSSQLGSRFARSPHLAQQVCTVVDRCLSESGGAVHPGSPLRTSGGPAHWFKYPSFSLPSSQLAGGHSAEGISKATQCGKQIPGPWPGEPSLNRDSP